MGGPASLPTLWILPTRPPGGSRFEHSPPRSFLTGIVFAAAILISLTTKRAWRETIFWLLSLIGVVAFEGILKPIFARPAPNPFSDDFAFPSGGAMAAMMLLASTTALLAPGRRRQMFVIAGMALVLVYGAALVYASGHYPTDVVGGWLLSLGWVAVLVLAMRPPGDRLERSECGPAAG